MSRRWRRATRSLVFVVSMAVVPRVVAAQPAPVGVPAPGSAPAAPAGNRSLAGLGFKGHLLGKNFSHFADTPTDNRHVRNEAVLQVEWARRLASWLDAKLVVQARDNLNPNTASPFSR